VTFDHDGDGLRLVEGQWSERATYVKPPASGIRSNGPAGYAPPGGYRHPDVGSGRRQLRVYGLRRPGPNAMGLLGMSLLECTFAPMWGSGLSSLLRSLPSLCVRMPLPPEPNLSLPPCYNEVRPLDRNRASHGKPVYELDNQP